MGKSARHSRAVEEQRRRRRRRGSARASPSGAALGDHPTASCTLPLCLPLLCRRPRGGDAFELQRHCASVDCVGVFSPPSSPPMASTAPAPSGAPASAVNTATFKPSPITCHVLDTVSGQPASALPVSLTLLRPFGPSTPLTSTTDSNGRVTTWDLPEGGGPGLHDIFANVAHDDAPSEMVWALKFDAGAYFKGEGWWDVVEVRFKTKTGAPENRTHWHVPLLLSPYSYTTYRGS